MQMALQDALNRRVLPFFEKAESRFNTVYHLFTTIHNVYSLAKERYSLNPLVHKVAAIFGNIYLVDIVFAVPRFIKNIAESVATRTIRPIVLAVSEACNVIYLVTECLQLLRKRAFFGSKVFAYLYIPNQVIDLIDSIKLALHTRKIKDIATCLTNAALTATTVASIFCRTTPLLLVVYTVTCLSSFALTMV